MFKKHPKGLLGAALANMGERFGFYTMMAILVLFLQTKFNLSDENAGWIYSIFYTSIYMLSLVGGIIADKTKKFKTTIFTGLILMAAGYVILSLPSETPVPDAAYTSMLILTCFALFIIAFGNGLFKGNLQALVGQMYDDPKYNERRDEGFSIFYMFINVGAIFAPVTAVAIRNWWIQAQGFMYHQTLPDVCRQFIASGGSDTQVQGQLSELAAEVGHTGAANLEFANEYLNIFTTGFHYAFAGAIVAMLISVVIYLFNQKRFPNPADKAKAAKSAGVQPQMMSAAEVKQRVYALFAVFAVVIFFWFSFHQNGLTLTYFAKDYIDASGIDINLGFTSLKGVELFQSINPFFVVFLTPVILAIFGWLRAKGKEPSTPRKIAIGMGIAALGFVVVLLASIGLPSKSELVAGANYIPAVTPWVMVICYFVLTVAELFISPLGISFVSKVAPPQYQGLMQALWLCATAVGNLLLGIGATVYAGASLETTWTMFIVVCVISMVAMFAMTRWLEKVAK